MATVVSPVSVPSHMLEALPEKPSQCDLPNLASVNDYYKIEDIRQSECTLVLFTRDLNTSKRLVMKLLREYKDTRYSLETVEKRQLCQLEALRRNRLFTPEVYLGLGRIDYFELDQGRLHISEVIKSPTQIGIADLDLQRGSFSIKEIISDPTKEMLDPNAEYALVMLELPEGELLANILSQASTDTVIEYIHLLSKYVVYIHNFVVGPTVVDDGEVEWGSHKQLQKKLWDNLDLLDLVLTICKNERDTTDYGLEDRLTWLKNTLRQVSNRDNYKRYFEQRVAEQRIKHCHGDLKALHIWITPQDHCCGQRPWDSVSLIDAADFNPSFTNIDILSDLAFLAIEIQARTRSSFLADLLIENYLRGTTQQDETSKAVLNYYLVEKGIVGTAISLVFDNEPDLGWAFLDAAEMRLRRLLEEQALPAEVA